MKKNEQGGFLTDEKQKDAFFVTLTDMGTGKDIEFKVISEAVLDGNRYFALIPPEEKGDDCIVLRASGEGDALVFETIEDDDEYDRVEDYFNDLLFNTSNYDD